MAPRKPEGLLGIGWKKSEDYFTIYIAFAVPDQNREASFATAVIADEPFFPAPHRYRRGNSTLTVTDRSNDRFSSFVVLNGDLESSNTTNINTENDIFGYRGNPRVGRCTYPSITWSLKAIDQGNRQFHYGTLNGFEPTITLDQN